MSMKSNFRSKNGCVVCGRKSSTSRFKSSEPYKDLFQAAFQITYRKGDFCNPCSLALNRYKKDPRDFSSRVDKCKRTGQERKAKPVPERKKTQRKQAPPKKWEPGRPAVGLPFPNAKPIKPLPTRRKRVATPDQPWMKYTNRWKPTVVYEGGLEFDALVNHSTQSYMINLDTARPCKVCAILKARKEGKGVEGEPLPTHDHTTLPTHDHATLPASPGHHLPPSPSTSSVASTSCSSKENMVPEIEEEEEEEGMGEEGMEEDVDPSAAEAATALMSYCQVAADSDFYRQQPMENAPRFLRAAPNQGIQPMPVGLVP